MKIMQFGEACSTQLNATSKVSKTKVGATDFVRFAKTCAVINACDKRATKVKLGDEYFTFEELEVPACLKQMIMPCVLTPNGDIDSEADFLKHEFGPVIEFDTEVFKHVRKVKDSEGVEKEEVSETPILPFDGYELSRFNSALYGAWKADAETVKVSDCRVAMSLSAEVIKRVYANDEVPAACDRNFPIYSMIDFFSSEVTVEDVDVVLKKWIMKNLTK